MTDTFPVWKRRLQRIAERMTKAVDCDLVMIRNTGADIEHWNATRAEACSEPTIIQLCEWAQVGLGSMHLFLSPKSNMNPDTSEILSLFEAAGAAFVIIPPEVKVAFDPLLFEFPHVQRWAGALVQTGFKGLPGTSLKARRWYVGTSLSEQLEINSGAKPLPLCWYSAIPNVLATSVDLIDSLIEFEIASHIPTVEHAAKQDTETQLHSEHVVSPPSEPAHSDSPQQSDIPSGEPVITHVAENPPPPMPVASLNPPQTEIASHGLANDAPPSGEVTREPITKQLTVKAEVREPLKPDGPLGTDTFVIDGVTMSGVSLGQMRFLGALLKAKGRAVDTRDLIGPGNVWEDDLAADRNAVGGMRKRINKLFVQFKIKRRIATSDLYRKVELKSGSPQKKAISVRKTSRPKRARKKPATRPRRAREM